MAQNQRLLVFPLAFALGQALFLVPFVAATHPSLGLDGFGQTLAEPERRVLDVLGASPGTGAVAAAVFAVLAGVLLQAWTSAAFIRSVGFGGVVLAPGVRTVGRLVAIYAAATAFTYVAADRALIGLVLAPIIFLLFGYADYVAVLEERAPVDAVRRSVELAARAWQASLLIFITELLLIDSIMVQLFSVPLHDHPTVSVPLVVAYLLTAGLVQYATDCALIAVVLEDRATGALRIS
jgi:hypothetical protein